MARQDFDLTADWSVRQGQSASWSCSGQLQSAGPSLCWNGFFVTVEQNDGLFHAAAFPRPVWVVGPVLCEGHKFSGQIAGTDVSDVRVLHGRTGRHDCRESSVRNEITRRLLSRHDDERHIWRA